MTEQNAIDSEFLHRAISLAQRGMGHTRPNPPVGAVIVKDGVVVGEGWHKKAGTDHAEVAAIKNAARRGVKSLEGATIYVSLEPCSKRGRVGACTDAIAASGIKRVVYACGDPNPVNRGKAKKALAKCGIECTLFPNPKSYVRRLAHDIIRPFEKHIKTGLPYVTVKIAMSLDGKICDDKGNAKWISSPEARKFTGKFRSSAADAVMVGAETVRKDDPLLLSHEKANPDLIRVVISKSGKLPKNARVFTEGANPTFVYKSPEEALSALGEMGVLHVFCEGGLKLASYMAEQNLVDTWLTVLSPIVIGSRSIENAVRGFRPVFVGGKGVDVISFFEK
jgi:diaminohydroxyphosphoribosylaminopyrimidine deaminase/5-amino-6-(5-phosphoribosylamino)uracil reductase